MAEAFAQRLLELAVGRHRARADAILLTRALWQSFSADGTGLEFALGLDHCLRQHWLIDYGERLVLTKAGYAVARSTGTSRDRCRTEATDPHPQRRLSPPDFAATADENGACTGPR